MGLPTPTDTPAVQPAPRRRPLGRQIVQVLRRGHLYAGLLMLPWVALYGATAFLFNHPTAFSDQPTTAFGRDALADTPLASPPAPSEVAAGVVAALQSRAAGGVKYTLVEPEAAKYTREAAFATVKAGDQELNVLVDVTGNGGTVRSRPAAAKPEKAEERAPFAVGNGGRPGPGGRGGRGPGGPGGGRMAGGERGGERGPRGGDDGLKTESPLHERVLAAVPAVLAKTGFPTGEVTVTSVPDLQFRMSDGAKTWTVTFNAQAGSVSGRSGEAEAGESALSARRFLTRLHTTHGYPGEFNAKWAWAVVVDAMAFIMLFWAASGVLMWWQIKATRWLGLLVLVVSAAAATWVGVGMHELLAAAPGRG